MDELDKTLARLRIILAEVRLKEAQLQNLQKQFHLQLERMPGHAIYGAGDLETMLSLMAEVEERLDDVERTMHHLEAIKRRTQEELECLELTQTIEAAKRDLASLEAHQHQAPIADAQREAEIKRLQQLIHDASARAAKSIAPREQNRGLSL